MRLTVRSQSGEGTRSRDFLAGAERTISHGVEVVIKCDVVAPSIRSLTPPNCTPRAPSKRAKALSRHKTGLSLVLERANRCPPKSGRSLQKQLPPTEDGFVEASPSRVLREGEGMFLFKQSRHPRVLLLAFGGAADYTGNA